MLDIVDELKLRFRKFKQQEYGISEIDFYKFIVKTDMRFIYYEEILQNLASKYVEAITKKYLVNNLLEKKRIQEMCRIKTMFAKEILPIFLKGSVISKLLYGETQYKCVGDIDIYVEPEKFNQAEKLLLANGYRLGPRENLALHTTYICDQNSIELHRFIVGGEIDNNTNFCEHYMQIEIDGETFWTLDITYHFLYLLYHLYRHIYIEITRNFPPELFRNSRIFKLSHFDRLYFEIGLYLAIYKERIDWKLLRDEIAGQKISVEFKDMIFKLEQMFPNMLEKNIKEYLLTRDYIFSKDSQLYEFIKSHYPTFSLKQCIKSVIEFQRESTLVLECSNIRLPDYRFYIDEFSPRIINSHGTYVISGKTPKSSCDLSFHTDFWHDDQFLYIIVDVTDDTLIFGPKGLHDTYSSDCVGVTIAHISDDYTYKNIYVFPYWEQGIQAELYSTIGESQEILEENTAVKIESCENGYKITLNIALEYLHLNFSEDVFYMDILVNDCDSMEEQRNSLLSMSSAFNKRYDPRTFAQILLKNN